MNEYELANAVLEYIYNDVQDPSRSFTIADNLKVSPAQVRIALDRISDYKEYFLNVQNGHMLDQRFIDMDKAVREEVRMFLDFGGFVTVQNERRKRLNADEELQRRQAQAIIDNTEITRQAVDDARAERNESARQAKKAQAWTIASVIAAAISAIAAVIAIFYSK